LSILASVSGTKARKSKPISAYPLFPAFVALWFGALFGLSSLAVGVPNLERAVAAVQLQLVLPSAAPPLGAAARALIALAMTGAGGLIGFVIALLIARGSRPKTEQAPPVSVRTRDTHPDAPVRKPISAHEELGDSDEHDQEAIREMQALRAAMADEPEGAEDEDPALPAFLAAPAAEPEPAETPHPAAFGLPIGEAAERIVSADLEGLSPVELLERLAIAMQRRLDSRSQAAEGETHEPHETPGSVTILPAARRDEPRENPDETEKALRDALAALQRMTGTA
jgi:hypothetical protein